MARYQFRCRECEAPFEVSRPMREAGDPAVCPAGHADTVRVLAVMAAVRGGTTSDAGLGPQPSGGAAMGGGCGAGCACAAGF